MHSFLWLPLSINCVFFSLTLQLRFSSTPLSGLTNFNGITYYFVKSDDHSEEDLQNIKAKRRDLQGQKTFKILTEDWIDDCIEKKTLISETDYEL